MNLKLLPLQMKVIESISLGIHFSTSFYVSKPKTEWRKKILSLGILFWISLITAAYQVNYDILIIQTFIKYLCDWVNYLN